MAARRNRGHFTHVDRATIRAVLHAVASTPRPVALLESTSVMDKLPIITDVHFEDNAERLKVVMPIKRNRPLAITYTTLFILWLLTMVWGVVYTIRVAFSGERYAFVFTLMLLILLFVYYRFGGFIRRQWAHFVSPRELLFINKERLILRRPVSIWGNTDAYDMQHVGPFYLADKPQSLAFDYGHQHIYFGEGLGREAQKSLRQALVGRYFPGSGEDEDDE